MKSKTILAFGNPVYDLISTPALRRVDRVLSGCSTNACLAARKLGEQAILVGTVGPDFTERLDRDLDEWRIARCLYPSVQTGGFSLLYDERGHRELSILGVADPIPSGADGFKHADFVLIGPILGETGAALVHHIRNLLTAPILLDPQGLLRVLRHGQVHHEHTPVFDEIAGLSTIVKANELETQVVTGIDPRQDPEGAARALHAFGGQIAVVTLAEAGSVIFDGKDMIQIPPYTINAIDPTGAGDTYAAGFMVKYLETPHDLAAVGCFASAVASVMVENSGPEFPLTRQEADRRMMHLLEGPMRVKLSV
jgi:sugar/nucleoside kinase (ribokinase family)